MLALRVFLKDAEKAKKLLIEKGQLDKTHKIKKKEKIIFFPVSARDKKIVKKLKLSSYTHTNFEKNRNEKNYKDYLKNKLTKTETSLLPSSFDVIGDIIILEIKEGISKKEKQIGKALLKANQSIRTILKKSGQHEGEFRTQKLKLIAGKNKKETTYKENNIKLKLNVEKVYFSSRLSTERKRICEQVKKGEIILVMFSGCGPYPIMISKNTEAKKILAIEKNPLAHKYALKNLAFNKTKNIELINGDVREQIPKLSDKFDRILMPLPKEAEDFLDLALTVSKKGTIIHFYDFEHERDIIKAEEKVMKALKRNKKTCKILTVEKCGQYSPGKFRFCVDFQIL
jgi:tRNA (guanine37-N1)-methyltransferase